MFPESVHNLAALGQNRQDRLQTQFYTFVLTDANLGRSYGFCLRGANYTNARIDIGQQFPECFCFITPHPHFNLFKILLSLAAAARWRYGATVSNVAMYSRIQLLNNVSSTRLQGQLSHLLCAGSDAISRRPNARAAAAGLGIFHIQTPAIPTFSQISTIPAIESPFESIDHAQSPPVGGQ